MSRGLIPSYKEIVIEIAANGVATLNRVGDVLTFLTVSGGPFEMQIDEGEASDVRAGITYKMPEGTAFKRVSLRDTAGAGGNLRVAVARGTISDARSVISGDTPVLNAAAPNNILQTALAAADPGLVALVAALVSELRDDASKRQSLSTLQGATYRTATATEADAVIVTALANVNGIIVRRAACYAGETGAETTVCFKIDGKVFCGWNEDWTISAGDVVENLFLPAGLALTSSCDSDDTHNYIWYEVL